MGPSKRSRVVKPPPKFSEEWPYNNGKKIVKSKTKKRKLSDMLGSQWGQVELEQFYDSYRKYGNDWEKVSASLQNRSINEVETLFKMNKAYLSLPEGMASAAGLIATMTDQYDILEGDIIYHEKDQVLRTSCKGQKHGSLSQSVPLKGSKGLISLQNQSTPSTSGCLSLLKKNPSADIFGGGQDRAVGKRTPRTPVPSLPEKLVSYNLISPNKLSSNTKAEVSANVRSFKDALALAKASKNHGFPQVSQGIDRKMEKIGKSLVLHDDSKEGATGFMDADNVIVNKDSRLLQVTDDSGSTTREYKMKMLQGKSSKGAEDREEAHACGLQGDEPLSDLTADEMSALDALKSLADCPPKLFPTSASESELRNHGDTRLKVRKERDYASSPADDLPTKKSKIGSNLPSWQDALLEAKQKCCPSTCKAQKGKGKIVEPKAQNSEAEDNAHVTELKKNEGTLFKCLSSQLLRRWCAFEWFYSAIDYPWFSRNDFVEYLNHAKLGHVQSLTRAGWNIIRRSLGKARRLSEGFLLEERMKLEQYRESARTYYAELHAGRREGLPKDLAIPLSVGQRVIACHPKTRDIHDGIVINVDCGRYRVQFDVPELNVEYVKDIYCMPLDPWENMPDDFRRQDALSQFCKGLVEETDGHLLQQESNNYPKFASKEISSVANVSKSAAYSHPCTLSNMEPRDSDIKNFAELARALEKKEALVAELKCMNDEVTLNQKDGGSVTNMEQFRMHYAMVLQQLQRTDDQVESCLSELRQSTNFHENSTPPYFKSCGNSRLHGPCRYFDSDDFCTISESHVPKLVETSMQKAKILVDRSVQDMSSLEGEMNTLARTVPTGDYYDRLYTSKVHLPGLSKSVTDNEITSPMVQLTTHMPGPNLEISSDEQGQIPSELISSCIAALFMIEGCSDRQYPPAEIAKILELAITNLQPCCSQNLPIYREIERCMGIIKSQMLALIPTPSPSLPAEVSA